MFTQHYHNDLEAGFSSRKLFIDDISLSSGVEKDRYAINLKQILI